MVVVDGLAVVERLDDHRLPFPILLLNRPEDDLVRLAVLLLVVSLRARRMVLLVMLVVLQLLLGIISIVPSSTSIVRTALIELPRLLHVLVCQGVAFSWSVVPRLGWWWAVFMWDDEALLGRPRVRVSRRVMTVLLLLHVINDRLFSGE